MQSTSFDRMRADRAARDAAEYERRLTAALRGEYGEQVQAATERALARVTRVA